MWGHGAQASQPLPVISIHSRGKYLLSTYYVPHTGLSAADAPGTDTDTVSVPRGLDSCGRDPH